MDELADRADKMPEGILLVDKPAGWTSFDAVAKVRGILRTANRQAMATGAAANLPKRVKVGHTGTLDPLATGLLVLLIGGSYTRRAPELTKLDKTYQVVMKLGETSTTGDDEGEKSPGGDRQPGRQEIVRMFERFTGDIMQVPPAFSAMKINGVRAYKLARQGKEVVLEARPATVHRLELADYQYPLVRFTADVSSGTYIRSLAQDIGRELGTGAYMAGLRRTRVGRFDVAGAVPVAGLDAALIGARIKTL